MVADVPVVLEVGASGRRARRSVLQKHELTLRSPVEMPHHLMGRSRCNRDRAKDESDGRNSGKLVDHGGILSDVVADRDYARLFINQIRRIILVVSPILLERMRSCGVACSRLVVRDGTH